jgi:protease PrsW
LTDEVGGPVTRPEYEHIMQDGLFRTRRIVRSGRHRSAALVDAQHELAFRKRRVRAHGSDPERDPLVAGWRREIEELRSTPPTAV